MEHLFDDIKRAKAMQRRLQGLADTEPTKPKPSPADTPFADIVTMRKMYDHRATVSYGIKEF